METLKFLFTSTFYPPYHVGGDAIHVQNLANELANKGHEVHVLHSLDAYNIKRKHTAQTAQPQNIHTYSIKTTCNFTAYTTYLSGNSSTITKKFKQLIKTINPDVVHHHNISLLGYNLLKKQKNYLNLYTAHDFWLICQQNNLLKNQKICTGGLCALCALKYKRVPQTWRRPLKKAAQEIDLLISPSKYALNTLTKKLSFKAAVVYPNFVPYPPSKVESSGFSNFFLYAGLLEKHKGILNLLEAFKQSAVEEKLLVAGTGSLENQIKQYINTNQLSSKIHMLGWTDHGTIYRLLNDAKAIVLPSICAENSPLIALEALSLGTPVIAANVGGLPEILEHQEKTLIFETPDTLKTIMHSFSSNDFPREKFREIFERNFSSTAYMNRYLAAIETLKTEQTTA